MAIRAPGGGRVRQQGPALGPRGPEPEPEPDRLKRFPLIGALVGMSVTLRNFFRRGVTVGYPERRDVLPARFRGRLYLDPNICVGCRMCEEACPNGALLMVEGGEVEAPSGAIGQLRAAPRGPTHIYPSVDIAMCTYCGWCEDVCPTGAIRHTHDFELARYDREGFVYMPERLSQSERELKAGEEDRA